MPRMSNQDDRRDFEETDAEAGRDTGEVDGGEHRRRPRYSGTHPRRFEERYKELTPAQHPGLHEHVRAQGRTPAGTHVPVLLEEVLAVLAPRPGEVVADCTVGFGGHAAALIERIAPDGLLVGFDRDAEQLPRTAGRLGATLVMGDARRAPQDAAGAGPRVVLYHSHFAGLAKALAPEALDGYDIIFADLGLSSMQIDDPARGFSYKHDGPLDMRMDRRLPRTGADVLREVPEAELAAALAALADEPHHVRIARAIVERRATRPMTRTRHLVEAVFAAKGMTARQWRNRPAEERQKLHPAARTFQALRMLVNDEIGGLEQFLRVAPYCLRPGGRLGVISFHSGEDSRVAAALATGRGGGTFVEVPETPIAPTGREVASNPRSRPARLRWARRG